MYKKTRNYSKKKKKISNQWHYIKLVKDQKAYYWNCGQTCIQCVCVCVKGQSEMVRANNNFACQMICERERKRESSFKWRTIKSPVRCTMIHQSCSSRGQGPFSTLEELLRVFKSLLCEPGGKIACVCVCVLNTEEKYCAFCSYSHPQLQQRHFQ